SLRAGPRGAGTAATAPPRPALDRGTSQALAATARHAALRPDPRQDARPARPRIDMVRIGMAVRRVRAPNTAVVAEERPLDVAALEAEVVHEDPGAVADVRLHVVQIGGARRPVPLVPRHDLHEPRSEEHTSELQSRENVVC